MPGESTGFYPTKHTFKIGPVPDNLVEALQRFPGVWTDLNNAGETFVTIPRNLWDLTRDMLLANRLEAPWFKARCNAVSGPNPFLRDYQIEAVDFLLRNECCILADSMGLGKSRVAAFVAVTADPTRPVLIVGPKIVRNSWLQELTKIGAITDPETQWCALEGTKPTMAKWKRNARYYFAHFEIVEAWWSFIQCIRPVASIIDEAHYVKNSRTHRSKGATLAVSASPYKILLTGTPILNRISEMWNLLNLTTGQWSWGKPTDFRVHYAGAIYNGYGWVDTAPTDSEELRARLETCYLRRTVSDVNLDLPPITREPVKVELDSIWRAKYASITKDVDPKRVINELLSGKISQKTLDVLHKMRKLTSRVKLPETSELAESASLQGESTVVFCWEREIVEQVIDSTSAVRGWAIHGGFSMLAREHRLDEFRRTPGSIVAATFGALGVGVNLQNARVVIMHDLDWTPATLLQAEARVWRQGQTRNVLSKWVVCADTLDEYLAEMILRKANTISTTLNDGESEVLEDVLGDLVPDPDEEVRKYVELSKHWNTWNV